MQREPIKPITFGLALANGQMIFSGNRIFWANFAIEVPMEKYRQIIFKDDTKQYISLHPLTGIEVPVPYTVAFPHLVSAIFAPVWNGGPEVGDIHDTTELEYIERQHTEHTG